MKLLFLRLVWHNCSGYCFNIQFSLSLHRHSDWWVGFLRFVSSLGEKRYTCSGKDCLQDSLPKDLRLRAFSLPPKRVSRQVEHRMINTFSWYIHFEFWSGLEELITILYWGKQALRNDFCGLLRPCFLAKRTVIKDIFNIRVIDGHYNVSLALLEHPSTLKWEKLVQGHWNKDSDPMVYEMIVHVYRINSRRRTLRGRNL